MSPLLVLIVAVLATTYAGPIVRFAAAPALAIAFWRLALVLPVAGGLAAGARRGERDAAPTDGPDGSARPSPLPLMVLAGLLLSLHFWSWIASLRYTAVASSVVLVSLKSVFAWAIAALWLHEHPTRAEAWASHSRSAARVSSVWATPGSRSAPWAAMVSRCSARQPERATT